MKIAALQMVSTTDVGHNLDTALRLMARAASEGAALVALPEYFCLMGPSDRDKLTIAEDACALGETPHDAAGRHQPLQRALSDAARAHGLWVIGGTLPMRIRAPDDQDGNGNGNGNANGNSDSKGSAADREARRVRNACCVFAPDGTLAARYDKIHLFRFDNGSESYDEGRVLQAGSEPVAFQAGDLRVGLSICYDLRFPELYRRLMQPPCDLLAVPAAFTHTTGRAHWELLLRARAVENQAYVIAPAQGGLHDNGRRTWGHSMVIDPWGEVLAVLPEGEGMAMAEMDDARLAAVRAQLPALSHRQLR